MEHLGYLFAVLSILAFIYLLIEIFVLTPKKALEWWNCMSHYGQSILIERYLGNKHFSDITDSEILKLYRLHLKRKQL